MSPLVGPDETFYIRFVKHDLDFFHYHNHRYFQDFPLVVKVDSYNKKYISFSKLLTKSWIYVDSTKKNK